MSFKKEWIRPGLRVITPEGTGELISYGEICEVKLYKPFALEEISSFGLGEIVIESDFTLVRAINCEGTLISNAQNYPTWEETLGALSQPFSQDETLIALNFKEKTFRANRFLLLWPYHLIEVYFDMYWTKREAESEVYEDLEYARAAWQRIDALEGTTGHILLCCLVHFETSRILGRAIFSALNVITKETWWEK